MAAISAVGLIFITRKKNKKSSSDNRGKRFLVLILAVVIFTPIAVKAAGDALTFNFKSSVALNDKLVLTYTNVSGVEETVVVKYGETISVPDELEKTGYNFLGWYNEKVKLRRMQKLMLNLLEDI